MTNHTRWIAAALLALAMTAGLALEAWAQETTHVLHAKRIYTGDGPPIEDGVLVVRGDQILSVGAATASTPAGRQVRVHDLGDAVIVPGLVDIRSFAGARRDLSDWTRPVQDDLVAQDVLDPMHADFETALQSGVTTIVLVPQPDNLVGGRAVAVKTAGASASKRMVRADGPLALAIGRAATRNNRVPTSRMGAYDLFRRTLDGAASSDERGALPAFARGKLRGVVQCSDATDVRFLLEQIGNRKLDAAVHATAPLEDALDELRAMPVPMIVGPYSLGTSERVLRAPGMLAGAGVEVAFAGGHPVSPRDGLRMTAALAARHGFPADQAVAAMTSRPARFAGIEKRVGTLAAGMDADFVVLTGDPLDLSARILEVYVDGARAHRDAGKE